MEALKLGKQVSDWSDIEVPPGSAPFLGEITEIMEVYLFVVALLVIFMTNYKYVSQESFSLRIPKGAIKVNFHSEGLSRLRHSLQVSNSEDRKL